MRLNMSLITAMKELNWNTPETKKKTVYKSVFVCVYTQSVQMIWSDTELSLYSVAEQENTVSV